MPAQSGGDKGFCGVPCAFSVSPIPMLFLLFLPDWVTAETIDLLSVLLVLLALLIWIVWAFFFRGRR